MNLDYITPTNFQEFWTFATGTASIVGIILVAFQLLYVSVQLRRARGQFELSQASETSKIFIEVMDRWSNEYDNRCKLLAAKPTTVEALLEEYGHDASPLLASEKWQKEIRPILNFFEFLGVLLSNEKFDQAEIVERIFTLVTVDSYPNSDFQAESGLIYSHLLPYLDYLRKEDFSGYRKDIYKYYDSVLLPKYIEYHVENEPHKTWAARIKEAGLTKLFRR